MAAVLDEKTNMRRNRLIEEIQTGQMTKEVLLNASFPFEEERQALYFSTNIIVKYRFVHLRKKFMESLTIR